MIYQCDDCEKQFFDSDGSADKLQLSKVSRLSERLDPGAVVPAGECDECGALVYIVESETD